MRLSPEEVLKIAKDPEDPRSTELDEKVEQMIRDAMDDLRLSLKCILLGANVSGFGLTPPGHATQFDVFVANEFTSVILRHASIGIGKAISGDSL